MKLKDLIPMLYDEGTVSDHRGIKVQIWPTANCIYKGNIAEFHKNVIMTNSNISCYLNSCYEEVVKKCDGPIGEFSVLSFEPYKSSDALKAIPEYKWPILIKIY